MLLQVAIAVVFSAFFFCRDLRRRYFRYFERYGSASGARGKTCPHV